MNILVTSLPDLQKIPIQRPHHIISYLSKKHNIEIWSDNAWWFDMKSDDTWIKYPHNVEYNYICNSKINPIRQEVFHRNFPMHGRNRFDPTAFDLHLNFNSLLFGYIVGKKMREFGKKVYFDICDDLPERFSASSSMPHVLKPFSKPICKYLLKKNMLISNRCTFITDSLKKSYCNDHVQSMVIPNGVDTELFHPSDSKDLKKRLDIKESDFVLGFSGILSEWSDLEKIFPIVSKLKKKIDVKFIVRGGGEKLGYYKHLAKLHDIDSNVIFTGITSYQSGPEIISCMDVCLISLKSTQDVQNSHPIKMFEYMACEKPIISTPLSGVEELGNNLVLFARDEISLEQNVITLFNDDNLRKSLGKMGREYVVKNFDWEIVGQKYEDILLEND